MSADNWAICPRCRDRAQAAAAARLEAAAAAYGKVPADEYEQMMAEAREPVDPDTFQTLREDYEFYGAEDGVVTASYGCGCEVCGLSTSFQHVHPFYDRSEDAGGA